MNKFLIKLPKLIRELQTTKGILEDQRDVHIVVKGSSNASSKKKKNNFGNTK